MRSGDMYRRYWSEDMVLTTRMDDEGSINNFATIFE